MSESFSNVVKFTLTREMATDIARELMREDTESVADIRIRRVRLWAHFVLGVAIAVFGIVVLLRSRPAPVHIVHLGVVAGILGLFSARLLWDWFQKRGALNAQLRDPIAEDPESFGEFGEVEFTLSERGIRWNSCGQTIEWAWTRIFRFDDLPSFIAVRGRQGVVMAIPKAAILPPGAEVFVATARAIHASKGTDQSARIRAFLARHDFPCPNCGYQLRDSSGDRCPECGHALTFETIREAGMLIAPPEH